MVLTGFDRVIMVDWSAGNQRGARPVKDAIWVAAHGHAGAEPPVYLRSRAAAEQWITRSLEDDIAAGRRVCIGFDFALAYPAGFGRALTGGDDPLAVWDWFAARVTDGPQANNRFDLAAAINRGFGGGGPFWFNGLARDIPDLPRKGTARTVRWENPRRATELAAKGSFECWQMGGAGAVGGQIFMGLPVLARLRRRFGAALTVWPFQPPGAPVTLIEIWPSLLADVVRAAQAPGEIRDAAQVRVMAAAIAALDPGALADLFDHPPDPEGWIFGAGHDTALRQAARRACGVKA